MSLYFISNSGKYLKSALIGIVAALLIQSQAWADQITLNLKDADIRALISTVSKFTGKNFIIDHG